MRQIKAEHYSDLYAFIRISHSYFYLLTKNSLVSPTMKPLELSPRSFLAEGLNLLAEFTPPPPIPPW